MSECTCRNFGPVEYRFVEPRCPQHGDRRTDLIRAALVRGGENIPYDVWREAEKALDALDAELETAKQEWPASVRHFRQRALEAEARVVAVEKERDAAQERYDLMVKEARKVNRAWRDERDKREALEAKCAEFQKGEDDAEEGIQQRIE